MVPYNQHSSLAIVSSRRFHFVAAQLLHAIALQEPAARTGCGSSILGMEMGKKYGQWVIRNTRITLTIAIAV